MGELSDDRHYVPGDWYRICDRTGFKVRASRTRKEWQNRIVRDVSWEPRNAQDFVRGVADEQYVPDVRPRQPNVFLGPLSTYSTAIVPAGTSIIPVGYTVRMQVGDRIMMVLDNTDTFYATITDIPSFYSIQISPALPYQLDANVSIVDVTAVSLPNIG